MEPVTDRLLARLLHGAVLGLITLAAGTALWFIYDGIALLCAASFTRGLLMLAGAAIPAVCCYALCRHADDLIDR